MTGTHEQPEAHVSATTIPPVPGGVWAAMPLPWNADGSLDRGLVGELVARYAAAGLQGAYCTGSDGEFHTLELDEFRTVVDTFAGAAERAGLPSQAGTGWLTARGALERTRHARDRGIRWVQVVPPFWMPLNDIERVRFYGELSAAVPDVGLVIYNTERIGRVLDAGRIKAIADAVPAVVGSKYDGWDKDEFAAICAATPDLVHMPVDVGHRPERRVPHEGPLQLDRQSQPGLDDGLVGRLRPRRLGRGGSPDRTGDGADGRLGSAARTADGLAGALEDLHPGGHPARDAAGGAAALSCRDRGRCRSAPPSARDDLSRPGLPPLMGRGGTR